MPRPQRRWPPIRTHSTSGRSTRSTATLAALTMLATVATGLASCSASESAEASERRTVWEATEYTVARARQELPFAYHGFEIEDTALHVSRRWLRGGKADQATPDVIEGRLGGYVELEQSPWPCCQTMTVYSEGDAQLVALFSSNLPVAEDFPASKYFSGLREAAPVTLDVAGEVIQAARWEPAWHAFNRGKRGLTFERQGLWFGVIWSQEAIEDAQVLALARTLRPE